MRKSPTLASKKNPEPSSLAACIIADLTEVAMRNGDSLSPPHWCVVVFRLDPFGFSGASQKELHAASRSKVAAMRQQMKQALGVLDKILEDVQRQIVTRMSRAVVIDGLRSAITSHVATWAVLAEGNEALCEILSQCESHGDNSWTSADRPGANGLFAVFTWRE
jgi:hypothetical protein